MPVIGLLRLRTAPVGRLSLGAEEGFDARANVGGRGDEAVLGLSDAVAGQADHLAIHRHGDATALAAGHRRADLEVGEAERLLFAQARDEGLGQRRPRGAGHVTRIADEQQGAADGHALAVGQGQRGHVCLDWPQHGQVGQQVYADDGHGLQARPVGQRDDDVGRRPDDVGVGQDIGSFDQYAAAKTAIGLDAHHGRRQVVKDVGGRQRHGRGCGRGRGGRRGRRLGGWRGRGLRLRGQDDGCGHSVGRGLSTTGGDEQQSKDDDDDETVHGGSLESVRTLRPN